MLVLLYVASSSSVFAFSFNPPDEKTGAPNEGNCTQCHTGNDLNVAGGSLMLTVPGVYTPGMEYDIVVELARAGQRRWGFQMTALNNNNARAGTFATSDNNTQLGEANSKQYIEHTTEGTAADTRNSNSWTFKWTAPSNDVGPIMFYAAGNAANNADGSLGDYIYIQRTTSDPVAYGVSLAGVGSLSKTVNTGVETKYTLRVTNNGNTRDTLTLSTSGVSSARLSRSSVSLDADTSANVTLTIPGSALTSAGEYKATVSASSQGDSSKSAEVITTTTILPEYSVSLAGEGSLTRQTTDASDGVSYTVKVTNDGNTTDTIRLTDSGDVSATISPTSVLLTAGASRNVTLTVSDSKLARAGKYDVKVTATSRGDSTKTADITTTTTILPVYGVTLEGISDLTDETSGDSVVYRIRVKNIGNTDDTITLSESGDVDATLSSTSRFIAYGSSSTVVLTIPRSSLTKAGVYSVKVIATSRGDRTKTADITTTTTVLPVYNIVLEGVGELTTETADASDGVGYTLKVTNNGNTDDVIDLATSGTAAMLSQESVSLASGASAEVLLTISGDLLALADTYEVKVTAISQGDDTQTVEITTTTTILPVYDISLEGVGDLTTETTDASDGVSYTLKVTNNGNTDDTIDLTISGTAATLSQESVSLTSGASAEVLLTISGDLLALADTYEVKVTAISQGDDAKTGTVTTTTTVLPVYGVTLTSDTLTGATTEANIGVTYTLTLTNTGNTDDTIVLGSSAEVGIGGAVLGAFNLPDSEEPDTAQLEIMLAAGESAEIAFIASGDLLTQPDEYEIVVTATSQGDTTKTAVLTTTTTITAIPPEYGVQLVGKDGLTGATWDFLTGVTYALTVTNTGNTEDTIVLGSSAEVDIEGAVLGSFSLPDSEEAATSQLQITLDVDESVEVNFTAAGDFFTKIGEYVIVVTATSQGDTTKTAEVTTTTTIGPVPWDLNADGTVNILDLVAVANQFGETGDGLSGDVNMDGTVNILDLVAVANQFGKSHAEIVQAANQ